MSRNKLDPSIRFAVERDLWASALDRGGIVIATKGRNDSIALRHALNNTRSHLRNGGISPYDAFTVTIDETGRFGAANASVVISPRKMRDVSAVRDLNGAPVEVAQAGLGEANAKVAAQLWEQNAAVKKVNGETALDLDKLEVEE